MADPAESRAGPLRDELKAEYLLVQNTYEDFDKRSLTIKGWVAAAAVAGASLGLKDGPLSNQTLVIVIVVLLSTWFLEAYWKMFQYGFRDRIRRLEAYFRNDVDQPREPLFPFQIYQSWYVAHYFDKPLYPYEIIQNRRSKPFVVRFLKAMWHPFVFLPYLPLLVCILAYRYSKP